jgi:hypothetical protein
MDRPLRRASLLQRSGGPATGSTEGRRTPRLDVTGQIQGYLVELDAPAIVCEIGMGGFRVATRVETPVGAEYEFRFTLGNGNVMYARARSIHSRAVASRDGIPHLFMSGFAFTADTWRGHATGELIDSVIASLSFDLG